MKARLLTLLCALFLAGCQNSPSAYDTSGNPVHFKNYRGQYVVLNYWASWCKPCYQEIPALNALAKKYPTQVKVFGIAYDAKDNANITAVSKKMGFEFPLLKTNPGNQFGIGHIAGLPATFIISPKGKLIKTLMGEQTETTLQKAMNLS